VNTWLQQQPHIHASSTPVSAGTWYHACQPATSRLCTYLGYWSLFFAQRGSKSVFKVLFLGKSNHMVYCKKWNYCNSLNILNCLIVLFGWGRWGNRDNFCLISTNKLAQRTRFKICFRCSLISHWWVEHITTYHPEYQL